MKNIKILIYIIFLLIPIFSYSHTDHELTTDTEIIEENQIYIEDDSLMDVTENQEKKSLSNIVLNTARIFGILGFCLLCISVFIGSTSRLFDKLFGLEKILRFHKKFSIFSYLVILLHPLLLTIQNIINEINVIDYYSGYLTFLPFIFGVISILSFGIIILITLFLFKIMNHLIWLNLHRLSAIFIIIVLIHIKNFSILSGLEAQIPLLNLFLIIGILFFGIGIIIRIILLFIKRKYKSAILKIIKETHDTTTIIIKKPQNFIYKSGQFCFISFNKKYLKKPHPFTISSSPNDEYLSFTIKSHKIFTSTIPSLNIGDKIIIDGPYGIFNFKKRDSVFIAGGVGITPFKSILGNNNINLDNTNIKLLYSNKTKNDIIFHTHLEQISNNLNLFNPIYIITRKKENGFGYGRINENLLTKHVNFTEDFYICGPSQMINKVIKILKKNKVPKKNIFTEKFFW